MEYTYKINKSLKSNISDLHVNNGDEVFICIYEILFKINSSKENPFLQYLMYKYPKTEKNDELMVFPFFRYSKGNVLDETKKMVKQLVNEDVKFKGYMKFEGKVYMFFGRENKSFTFKQLQSTNKYWWCLMDEICNKKQVIHYPIHKSAYRLFLSNPNLIYLYESTGAIFETPVVAFIGNHYDVTSYVAAFGLRRSTASRFGPFFTLGTFNRAVRYAGWTGNYQKHIFRGKAISDDNGKYFKGGIIRYATFLGDLENYYVIMNNNNYFENLFKYWDKGGDISEKKLEKQEENLENETGKWSTHFKSLVVPKIKLSKTQMYFNINTEYIVSDNNSIIALSIHEVDNNTLLPIWDPLDKNYRIL
jgi:hypothetical protein